MPKEGVSYEKKSWVVMGAVCIGVLFFLFTSRPISFFDAEFAKGTYVQGSAQHKMISIPDTEQIKIVDAFTKARISWIPRDGSKITGPVFGKDEKFYVNLVFGEQMFVDLFVYDDDSMAGYIYPWNRPLGMRVEYKIANPEVLRNIVDITVKCGMEEGIIEAEKK